MKLKNVVVQIPCLNEEEGIGQVIKQIKKENSNFRIIVYDNGSIDKSVDIVKKIMWKSVMLGKKVRAMWLGRCFRNRSMLIII